MQRTPKHEHQGRVYGHIIHAYESIYRLMIHRQIRKTIMLSEPAIGSTVNSPEAQDLASQCWRPYSCGEVCKDGP